MVDYIKKHCDNYNRRNTIELRQLTYQFAVKIGAKYPQNWDESQAAGRHWYYSFKRRQPDVGNNEEETTSEEPSTSSSLSLLLTDIDSLQTTEIREKKEKRKLSTSPTKITEEKSIQRDQPPKKTPKKSTSGVDIDFCIICLQQMPLRLNHNNSIACIECNREVHLGCANMTGSIFVCQNCNSE